MIPFIETVNSKEELLRIAIDGYRLFSEKKVSKNDFLMYFGFTHGEAITKFYASNTYQVLLDAGFNTGSEAYFSAGINAWKNLKAGTYTFPPFIVAPAKSSKSRLLPLQQIFYGAPGTGKSRKVHDITERVYPEKEERDKFVFRTTFHPDYDYASLVGCYKPKKEDDKITYSFVPQVFTNAYIKAWKEMKNEEPKPVYLVIEEINRGNCAQIFGDLFQLLDRGDDGYSEYPIDIDDDLKNYLIEKLGPDSEGVKDGKMCLPPNLNIWATMNTSDQSLFPMDSAFKRRWEWEYVKIADAGKNWKIKLDDGFELIDWWTFLKRINRVVAELTTSEDKQLGYFFCKPDVKENDADEEPTIISAKRFVNKVIFYLWNDVFKGYAYDADCCKDVNQKEVLYEKFYSEDGTSPEIEVLKVFFDKLKNEGEASLVVDGTTDGDTPQPEESTNETAAEGNETEA